MSDQTTPRISDDLFDNSSMTFGAHLEELRTALFRSMIGLMIGFLIGLFVAKEVVKFIQSPLKHALEDYYITSDIEELGKQLDSGLSKEMTEFIRDQRVISEEILVEPAEIRRLTEKLGKADEKQNSIRQALLERLPKPENVMLKTRVWRPVKTRITSLNAQEAFLIWLKAGMISGVIIASPYIFYQIWCFVAAGLYPHERRYMYIYLPFSVALFLAGAAMAFFMVFEPVLDFLFGFNRWMDIEPDPRISEWISFVLFLPLGFGIAFQLPLVMLMINRLGIISVEVYLDKWRIAVLVIFVLSMLLTPADPISMLMMAMPLTVLYFLGVGLCQWMPRGRNPFAEEVYEP